MSSHSAGSRSLHFRSIGTSPGSPLESSPHGRWLPQGVIQERAEWTPQRLVRPASGVRLHQCPQVPLVTQLSPLQCRRCEQQETRLIGADSKAANHAESFAFLALPMITFPLYLWSRPVYRLVCLNKNVRSNLV